MEDSNITLEEYETDNTDEFNVYFDVNCNDNSKEENKRIRGLIYDKNNNLLVKTFDYSSEFTSDEEDKWRDLVFPEDRENRFFSSEEGSILRIFFYKNKFHISTLRKSNAFNSRWSTSLTFGEEFLNALISYVKNKRIEIEYEKEKDIFDLWCDKYLDKKYCYCFLLRNSNRSRIVCDGAKESTIYSVGCFDRENNHRFLYCELDGIPYPKEYYFRTVEDIRSHLKDCSFRENQGIVLFSLSPSGEIFTLKIVTSEYRRYFLSRRNEPSIKICYLKSRGNDEDIKNLIFLYPEYVPLFSNIEKNIHKISFYIYKNYVDRYIHKKYVFLPKDPYNLMVKCHNWHLEDRKKNRISVDKIKEEINKLDSSKLDRLINSWNSEMR